MHKMIGFPSVGKLSPKVTDEGLTFLIEAELSMKCRIPLWFLRFQPY